VILDLEDAVVPGAKEDARALVLRAVRDDAFADQLVAVLP
jgi:citrate lyase beta subunit